MDKHYYLISQLPLLEFDSPPDMPIEAFREEARKWLKHGDYVTLLRAVLFDTSLDRGGPVIWKRFKRFEYELRNDVALWRRARQEGEEYKPTSFSVSLVKEGNPLEVEKNLLQFRWEYLEDKEKEHHFDMAFLIIFYLKLQILDQLALYDPEKGMAAFREISKVTE